MSTQWYFTRNGREACQEFLKALSAFQIIEQGLRGNARSAEDGHAVHDFGIANDGLNH